MSTEAKSSGGAAFIILMAMLTSLVALSIDAMLPALPDIGRDLGVKSANDPQLVIATLFGGLAVGQLFYGPLSDSFGRRPMIFVGLALFVAGSLVCAFAQSFEVMLAGRLVQGFGAAGPRIVTMALIRDLYEGRAMARVMSFIMGVFILVPAIAPALGQGVIYLSGWRAIFFAFLVLSAIVTVWFALAQEETLPRERRTPLSLRALMQKTQVVCTNGQAMIYTLVAGLIFAAFVPYLSTAQQILQVQYALGAQFPAYFALLALAFGAASLVNARLVLRLGMRYLNLRALIALCVVSVGYAAFAHAFDGHPPFWSFMAYGMINFFCLGLVFGNCNALAMEPLGDHAGIGAAIIGFATTIIAVIIGGPLGLAYDGTVMPLLAGYSVLGALSLGIVVWFERG